MEDIKHRILNKCSIKSESDCWEWTAGTTADGYGRIKIGNKALRAHRLSYAVFNGEIPAGLLVLHRCDNRKCINPHHLFLGDNRQNINDMLDKKRQCHGANHPSSKIDATAVQDIRHSGLSVIQLMGKYNLSESQIYRIKNRQNWKI